MYQTRNELEIRLSSNTVVGFVVVGVRTYYIYVYSASTESATGGRQREGENLM